MGSSSPSITSRSIVRLSLGWWRSDRSQPTSDPASIRSLIGTLKAPLNVVSGEQGLALAVGGETRLGTPPPGGDFVPLFASLPPVTPDMLGDPAFMAAYGLRYPYMTGAMANGIASAEIVEAMGQNGMLGSFGAAGLSVERVAAAIDRIQGSLGDSPYCFNLIHSPNEPAHENAIADLYIRRGVRIVEASAYLDLTPAIVRYRAAGIRRGSAGLPLVVHRVIAKVSRVEVATKFLSPPPARMLQELVAAGQLTAEQADAVSKLPMCDDLTVEADSGGHTDNRPAITLLPTILALRDRLQEQFKYPTPVRVGLAGGIATPASVAGAFSMGAAYVVTGSVNQACVESGSSDVVRKMLAEAGQADTAMAPAADMFEMGVKLQVLKRGTMFPMRAQKLFEVYRAYSAWDAVPNSERMNIEKNLLRRPFEEVWAETKAFFERRDPTQLPKAETDPKHKMALVFRWYLGLSSRWANVGENGRQLDYQVWCGPAMGAFNEWVKGSYLEEPRYRNVTTVAMNLLYGACVVLRRQSLAMQGVHLPSICFPTEPLSPDQIEAKLR
ncbi:PfaD family polyunsaturated fatty acid/polyketide biosynthesis protein [Limnoglobus roseus]|uniref:2-nitropropane dioxygenase n=1 Tax=Limnoglobus roseus TaxID=2598579 RepID=A0A5C1A5A0_9BACT|nr:PfaD family polyunsaturated fatty acid/polyketide biosynthesis protein [Limnoglobus roseus]QEL14309.1 2-nitropropane dioxygenase [Limnoglobus roseus]